MMDFHILIVISCVFLASLCSLLFINKFFRRKTFEEIIAEKKAMTEKIYGQTKAAAKKPKKLQQLKKEAKREKKQRQKEQQKDNNTEEHAEDSDAPSEQLSVEDDQPGLSKHHVEFEPEPELLAAPTPPAPEIARRASNAEKENVSGGNSKQKSKKDKKGGGKSGILVNKNEPVVVKENPVVDEQLNHFETKQPKDVIELKKQEKKDEQKSGGKKEKGVKKDKHSAVTAAVAEKPVVAEKEPSLEVVATKELKQQDEKVRQGSPKNQQQNSNNNNNSTKSNNKQNKKQIKETAATKELVLALDKLNETDTVGVSLLMNLFRRAELNRSEIQILIDYLLNKQQDMPSSHSEWSDDICQKLKRQLEEKERALIEQQEASVGIQAKLRELRLEINSERAQMNATIKAYIEKLQSKDSDVAGLNQEMQALNEKIALERQQFQAKLLREKQAGSQDLLAQMQLMQNELAHKDQCMNELTLIVNASHQAVEESAQQKNIIQSQLQQIRALEQQRDELEQVSNNRIFELEQTKTLETENAESKVEIRNLQNAFESYKVDMTQSRNELEAVRAELVHVRTVELVDRHTEIQSLQSKNAELTQQLAGNLSKSADLSKEQSGLQVTLDELTSQLAEKERQLGEFNANNAQLVQQFATAGENIQQHAAQQQVLHSLVDSLKADVAGKQQQLQEVEQIVKQSIEQFGGREKELLQQLHEQKEKNNDLRMKNWKLVEALQNAETTVKQNKALSSAANANLVQQQQILAATQKSTASADPVKDPKQIRELFQRLYPDAVKASAGTALSASFEQWVEQVLATHIKQSISKANAAAASSSNKSTQSNSSSSSPPPPPSHNSHNNNTTDNLLNSEATNNSNSRTNSSSIGATSSPADNEEVQTLHKQNAQLRTKIDELTKLVKITSNTLSDIEVRAREQDEHWRSVVRSKDEQIYTLKHSNGEQDI